MTPEWLAEIEARAQAATEGPWAYHCFCHCDEPEECEEHWQGSIGATDASAIYDNEDGDGNWLNGHRFDALPATREDAAFVAHARQDVPDLCAEVRRLRKVAAVAAKLYLQGTERYTGVEWDDFSDDELRELATLGGEAVV